MLYYSALIYAESRVVLVLLDPLGRNRAVYSGLPLMVVTNGLLQLY